MFTLKHDRIGAVRKESFVCFPVTSFGWNTIFLARSIFLFIFQFCTEVPRVIQVRVFLQMFALQGLRSRGFAVDLTDVCP